MRPRRVKAPGTPMTVQPAGGLAGMAKTHRTGKPVSGSRKKVTAASETKTHPIGQVRERERRRKFVEHFMTTGNATQAAILAGYSRKTASQIGYRLLRKVQIQQAIDERVKADPAVADRDRLQRFWTAVVDGKGSYINAALKDRLRASELLGKSQGVFVERREMEAGESLFELLGGRPLPSKPHE